ncbi:hypothetical protein P7K49_039648 [Saguinus oedipus]|uniref:Uncharacterized protein n=1 Tax=Saguinus oedipus TaxID=9490 RepID=A0ABQ9TBH8_SAGOE|nr:hypothetical protein P7K49_039648 [Saguinus oedipus]
MQPLEICAGKSQAMSGEAEYPPAAGIQPGSSPTAIKGSVPSMAQPHRTDQAHDADHLNPLVWSGPSARAPDTLLLCYRRVVMACQVVLPQCTR